MPGRWRDRRGRLRLPTFSRPGLSPRLRLRLRRRLRRSRGSYPSGQDPPRLPNRLRNPIPSTGLTLWPAALGNGSGCPKSRARGRNGPTGTMLRRINAGLLADNGQAADESKSKEPGTMAADGSFCLFHCGSLPFAVAVANVAEIAEVDALVRIGLCPPRIAGLCPYHRQVVPVVTLGQDPSRSATPTAEQRNSGKAAREVVLIVQTGQGM